MAGWWSRAGTCHFQLSPLSNQSTISRYHDPIEHSDLSRQTLMSKGIPKDRHNEGLAHLSKEALGAARASARRCAFDHMIARFPRSWNLDSLVFVTFPFKVPRRIVKIFPKLS